MSKQSHILEDCFAVVELAGTYAEDGAFFTAAERLEKAVALMRQHAENCRLAECAP